MKNIFIAVFCFCLSTQAQSQFTFYSPVYKQPPNIVIILADDLGYGDVSYNQSALYTPNLERIASESLVLNRFYAHPVCTPTRAALLGGIFPHKVGLSDYVIKPWQNIGYPTKRRLLSDHLNARHYKTHIVGKWHLGHLDSEYLPHNRGFDSHYGHLLGRSDYFNYKVMGQRDFKGESETVLNQGKYTTTLFGDKAVSIIRNHQYLMNPLFLFVPFTAPHTPLQANQADMDLFQHLPDLNHRIYAAMVYALDREVGKIYNALKQENRLDNTFFLFLSDNGGYNKSQRGRGDNRPFDGDKNTLAEGGLRVPAILHYQGRRGVDHTPLHVIDIFKTATDLAGSKNIQSDGMNMLDLIDGITTRSKLLLHHDGYSTAYIDNGLKIIRNKNREYPAPFYPQYEAYDLLADPTEKNNIIDLIDIDLTIESYIDLLNNEAVTPLSLPDDKRPPEFGAPPNWQVNNVAKKTKYDRPWSFLEYSKN